MSSLRLQEGILMNLSSLWEMTKGRWREFCREPSAFFFVIFMPLVWMLILGHAFNPTETFEFRVGILEHGESSRESEIKSLLEEHPQVELLTEADDLKKGNIPLFVEFKDGVLFYHQNKNHKEATKARLWVDEYLQTQLGRVDTVPTQTIKADVGEERYIDFLIPGLLTLSIFTTSLFGTGMILVSNRRENLLKRYAATPMSSLYYIVSHILGRFSIFFVEFLVIALGGYFFFDFTLKGSWLAYFFTAMLGVASFTSLAILFSSRTKNTALYNGFVNVLTLTMMFPSGIWFPRSDLPLWMQRISDFLPLTALVEILRGIALEGEKFANFYGPTLILCIYLFLCTFISRKIFRWY